MCVMTENRQEHGSFRLTVPMVARTRTDRTSAHFPDLAIELWSAIIDELDRSSLNKVCLTNKTLHTLALRPLYRDPFKANGPPTTLSLSSYSLQKRQLLCQVLASNPRLAERVRVFRTHVHGIPLRPEDIHHVAPKLRRLTSAHISTGVDAFATLCPSVGLEEVSAVAPETSTSAFWPWLEGQKRIKRLSLMVSSSDPDDDHKFALAPDCLPQMEELRVDSDLALAFLVKQQAPPAIRYFDGSGGYWSRRRLTMMVPLLGVKLKKLCLGMDSKDLEYVFGLLNEHSPKVEDVRLLLYSPNELVRLSPFQVCIR